MLDVCALKQDRRDLGEQGGFVCPLFRLGGTFPRSSRQLADDYCRHEVNGERDPVFGVGELEGVLRRQEEPVEGEHAHKRGAERVWKAADDRDRQDREQVQDAEAQNRGDVL
jgi:hypothetical protein